MSKAKIQREIDKLIARVDLEESERERLIEEAIARLERPEMRLRQQQQQQQPSIIANAYNPQQPAMAQQPMQQGFGQQSFGQQGFPQQAQQGDFPTGQLGFNSQAPGAFGQPEKNQLALYQPPQQFLGQQGFGQQPGQSWRLHDAAANGNTAEVEKLLSAGADVNSMLYGTTSLHKAAEKGHHDVVAVLLSYNADGTINDRNGRTALDLMAQKYKEDITPLFVKNSVRSPTRPEQQMPQNLSATEQKLLIVEKMASIGEERAVVAEKRAVAAEERAVVAEKRAVAAEERAGVAEKRASVAEERAAVAEKRASMAEERIKVPEMKAIVAEKKAADAVAMMKTFQERTREAEDTVKMLQDAAHVSDTRIAELGETNAALEGRATQAEMQICSLTSQCRQLHKQLDGAKTPSWVVKKENILLTDKELGRGGWGVVKAARFCGLEVAAKLLHGAILSPRNQQMFKREMNIAASVRHPNILLFIGATMDQECVILTELMQTSLRAVLEEKEANKLTMSRQQVSSIALDVGKALNYLHLLKPDAIIHRDVSSSNVLLEPLGAGVWKAKLSDFGSSNFARQISTVGPGNATYAAPESSDPDLQSPKMDVFSFGVLLLEMSGGHFPDMLIRQDLIQVLSWSKMKTMILECTAKDIQRRPSMADVLIKLPNT